LTNEESRVFQSSIVKLHPLLGHKPGKMLEGTVIRPFRIRRKKAGGEFSAAQVIAQAIATRPLFGTRFIGAVACLFVFLYTVHRDSRFQIADY
jgi:hypothetical protein